jgi:hypothetical protein
MGRKEEVLGNWNGNGTGGHWPLSLFNWEFDPIDGQLSALVQKPKKMGQKGPWGSGGHLVENGEKARSKLFESIGGKMNIQKKIIQLCQLCICFTHNLFFYLIHYLSNKND